VLYSLQDPVLRVFEVARLKEGFSFYPDEVEAVAAAARIEKALKNRENKSTRKRSA